MTIGPEPITRTRLMSVRLGMGGKQLPASSEAGLKTRPTSGVWRVLRSFLHLFHELVEQVVCVVRTGRRLGMVLHAEHRLRPVAKSLDRPVVQVDVRDRDVRR